MTSKKTDQAASTEAELVASYLKTMRDHQIATQTIAAADIKEKLGCSLDISIDGKVRMSLNGALVQSRNLDAATVERIKELHISRLKNIDKMQKLNATDDRNKLRELAERNEQIEYELQDAWGFPRDNSYHYWYDLPHCTCPRMDNMDLKGTSRRIINSDCPLHGA